jgi:Zn-dependent protease with chaperone function
MLFRRQQEAAEATTWGLLAAFGVSLAVLVVAVNLALMLALRLTVPIASGYPTLFFETNTAVVLLFVLGGCWVETLRLREGGAYVARLAGARPAETSGRTANSVHERRLVNVAQEMALAARCRPPAVWVIPRDQSINAFAAGWAQEDALIAVTQGALERLTRAELQGLVAHETGHLVSGDTRLNMRLIGLVWGLQMVYGLGCALTERDERGNLSFGAIIGFALMAVGWVGWLAGRALQAAVSRQREYHADASAVQYARTVDGIGGVLRKIAGLPTLPRPRPPESLAHLWMAEASGAGVFGWRRWLATHPSIAERLRRLYGRSVAELDAPLLPPPADEPLLAMAPSSDAMASTVPMVRIPERPAIAVRAVPTQDERDALQRSAFWRSRTERHAALLAWLIAEDGAQAPWSAWSERVGKAAFVERLREDWMLLGPSARWQVFDALVASTRAAGAEDRFALMLAARGMAPQGAARMRLLLLRRSLRRAAPSQRGRRSLEELEPALQAATALVAQTLGPHGVAWAAALAYPAMAPARGAPLRAFALRYLHAMQRPRVARAWAEAAAQVGLLRDDAAASHLVVACRLLDTPLPSALLSA